MTYAQDIDMVLVYCVIAIEMVMVLLLFPFKFAIKTHMSLNEKKAVVELRLFGLSVIRLKCVIKGEIELYINGKRKVKSGGKVSQGKVIELVRMLKSDILYTNMLALVGGDAKNCAIICAIINLLPFGKKNAYLGTNKDKFDVDINVELALNLVEIAGLIAINNQE